MFNAVWSGESLFMAVFERGLGIGLLYSGVVSKAVNGIVCKGFGFVFSIVAQPSLMCTVYRVSLTRTRKLSGTWVV